MCSDVLHCAPMYVLMCALMCCIVLQCTSIYFNQLQCTSMCLSALACAPTYSEVFQRAAVDAGVLQCTSTYFDVPDLTSRYLKVLQCALFILPHTSLYYDVCQCVFDVLRCHPMSSNLMYRAPLSLPHPRIEAIDLKLCPRACSAMYSPRLRIARPRAAASARA